MNEILTLTWKEYRNNIHLLVFAISVLALPIIWATSITLLNARPEATYADMLAAGMMFGSVGSIIFSQFVMLCLGGHLIAGERGGRTFEFLFLQPVSRRTIALSKLLFAFVWSVATWLLVGFIAFCGYMLTNQDNGPAFDFVNSSFFVEVAVVGLLLFATSWFASSMLNNSVVSMCAGAFASTCVFIFLLLVVRDRFEPTFSFYEYDWTRILIMFPISVTAIVAGLVRFIKRKSP
ncbi:MAG: ABC transporter permease subunit [Planctomycetota bacterium]